MEQEEKKIWESSIIQEVNSLDLVENFLAVSRELLQHLSLEEPFQHTQLLGGVLDGEGAGEAGQDYQESGEDSLEGEIGPQGQLEGLWQGSGCGESLLYILPLGQV